MNITHTTEASGHGKKLHVIELNFSDDKKWMTLIGGVILHEQENIVRVIGMHVAPEYRRQGFGNQIMEQVVSLTDVLKKPAYLEVDSHDINPANSIPDDQTLRYWYGRFGFDDVPGHPFAMVRYPK